MRDSPVFELLQTHLSKSPLPDTNDLLSYENYEFALLCMDKDSWSSLLQRSMIEGNTAISTGSAIVDELEAALQEGEDFHDIIQRLGR